MKKVIFGVLAFIICVCVSGIVYAGTNGKIDDVKADRAKLMASQGLFNIAAIDDPAAYGKQVVKMGEQARGAAPPSSKMQNAAVLNTKATPTR